MKHTLFASALVAALALASPRADATGCTSPSECTSGFCVNGVCCDTKCDGVCEACSAATKLAGDDGTCGPAATTKRCRESSCTDGNETRTANCDDKGACPAVETAACGAYACDGPRCRTSCPPISWRAYRRSRQWCPSARRPPPARCRGRSSASGRQGRRQLSASA